MYFYRTISQRFYNSLSSQGTAVVQAFAAGEANCVLSVASAAVVLGDIDVTLALSGNAREWSTAICLRQVYYYFSLFLETKRTIIKTRFFYRPSRPMSPIPNFDDDNNSTYFQDDNINDEMSSSSCEIGNIFEPSEKLLRNKTSSSLDKNDNNHRISSSSRIMDVVVETGGDCLLVEEEEEEENFETPSSKDNDNGVVHRVQSANTITLGMPDSESNLPRDVSSDTLADARLSNTIAQIARLNPDLCGMPLELFTKVIIFKLFF